MKTLGIAINPCFEALKIIAFRKTSKRESVQKVVVLGDRKASVKKPSLKLEYGRNVADSALGRGVSNSKYQDLN